MLSEIVRSLLWLRVAVFSVKKINFPNKMHLQKQKSSVSVTNTSVSVKVNGDYKVYQRKRFELCSERFPTTGSIEAPSLDEQQNIYLALMLVPHA